MNLESRVIKLESRAPSDKPLRGMSDEQLERMVREATPEERAAILAEHPEFRELFEELSP